MRLGSGPRLLKPVKNKSRRKPQCVPILYALLAGAAALGATAASAQTVLKASHQFPGGKGDPRDEMVQIIAREAKAANVGLEIQVYPGASLFKPNDQWNAIVNGQLDISSFPLDYACGKVGAFSATLMPGLVRNHDRAARLNGSDFMKEIKAKIDKAGVVVLADAWLAGAVASKKSCIRKPEDIKGQKIRSAGPTFAAMWQQAGASIVNIPSNEVYNALQTGVAEATDTSTGSFVSFRLYEQVKCVTAPGDNALWFMYEPVLMSKRSFNKLNKQQQDVLLKAGKKSEEYFNAGIEEARRARWSTPSRRTTSRSSTLTPEEYDAWLKIAQESSYKQFAERGLRRQEADRCGAFREVARRAPRPAAAGPVLPEDVRGADGRFHPWGAAALAGLRRLRRAAHRGSPWSSSARWFSSATCSNETTIWQTDFVTFSLVAATFIGAPYVLLTKGHVNVDVLPIYVGQRARWWLALVAIADLARLRAHHGGADLRVLASRPGRTTGAPNPCGGRGCGFPYGAMPIGLGVLTLQYVVDLVELVTGREPPFGMDAGLAHGLRSRRPGI